MDDKYIVSGVSFKTKKSLRAYIQELISRYKTGECLNSEDFAFMRELLDLHPEVDQKIGCGIIGFKKVNSIYGPGHHLILLRWDGTYTDFSWNTCITPRSKTFYFNKACRNAVAGDIVNFKVIWFGRHETIICPLTGETITFNAAVVDHAPPDFFYIIRDDWVKENNIDIDTIEIIEANNIHPDFHIFKNVNLIKSFREYHNSRARLRIVSKKGNIQVEKERRQQNGKGLG